MAVTEVVTRKTFKIRTDEFDRMADAGVFDTDRARIELIGGQLLEMAPIGTAHLILVTRLAQQLSNINGEGRLLVQQPIRVTEFDEPQPDLVVLSEPLGLRKPEARDCDIIIEVSDSTYKYDRDVKTARYLQGGAGLVLIINVAARWVETYCEVADLEPGTREDEYQNSGTFFIADAHFDVDALFEGLGPKP